MSQQEIHVGDIGTKFEATVKDDGVVVDISAASTKQIIFKKPDGTVVPRNASLSGTGTDGKMYWTTTQATDLDQAGLWQRQGVVALSGGSWHSDVQSFTVYENLG